MSEQISHKPHQTDARRTDDRRRYDLLQVLGLELANMPIEVRAALEAMAGEIISLRDDQAALREALQSAEQLADRDGLCPVFNRRAFERELGREIALAERYATPLSLIYIDLDRFKLVNDRFGHATGDRVIQHVANVLLEEVRQTDIVGRLGGDEFAIALTHATYQDTLNKAKALQGVIDHLVVRDAEDTALPPVQIGASCGIVEWQRGLKVEALIAQADEAMFRAKTARKRDAASA